MPWLEEANQIGRERVIVLLGPHQRTEAGKTVFAPGIDRLQMNRAAFAGRAFTSSENVDRHVHSHGSRVKQIQWPQIKGGTGQFCPTRRLREYLVSPCRQVNC